MLIYFCHKQMKKLFNALGKWLVRFLAQALTKIRAPNTMRYPLYNNVKSIILYCLHMPIQ